MIIGYGEDALTMWALSRRMSDVLRALGDATLPTDALVFYRPSCGRGERPGPDARYSLFGEFDAIVGTAEGVYLVEAKWRRARRGNPAIDDVQRERHRIFRTYLALWRKAAGADWAAFVTRAEAEFALAHPGWRLAHGDVSVGSIKFLLERLVRCGDRVTDVLLVIGTDPGDEPKVVGGFTRVPLAFTPLAEGVQFFDTQIVVQA